MLAMVLQTVAILLAKYGQAKNVAEEIKVVLGVGLYADQLNSLSISEEQLEALKSMLRLDQVKERVLKLKATVRRNIEFTTRPDDHMGPRRRKEARNVHSQSQPVYDFLDLWLR